LLALFRYNYGMFAKGTDKDVLRSSTSALKGFEAMLTRKDVASILGISERQVCRLEKRGCLPRVHISTNVVRYLPKDLHQLIESMRVERN
jgi:DNA-binding XRE family transcriptional regulator